MCVWCGKKKVRKGVEEGGRGWWRGCVCVCVCEDREEKGREGGGKVVLVRWCVYACMCTSVCVIACAYKCAQVCTSVREHQNKSAGTRSKSI